MLIPTTAGSALLYTLLIPLCLPNGKSLGKLFLHLVVLSKDGYELKKIWLLPRSLSYIVIELLLGVASFGATFLISYTMCMFMKEHRCIHDLLSNSVVAEEETSFWFKDEVDEEEYLARNPENEAY